MPPAKIVFPISSSPGFKPGEGSGRLINCYADKDGENLAWFRSPGFVPFVDVVRSGPRGFLATEGVLYGAFLDKLVSVNTFGTVQQYFGDVAGSAPVTMARNNRAPTPDIAIVADAVAYSISGTTVVSYADSDVGSPNSVSVLDGYFLFTYGNGDIIASGLNDPTINTLSTARAESNPDGLVRGIVRGGVFYAMGSATIEPWRNAGTSPFPLERYPTILPVGLIGPWAVAGMEDGWDGPVIFVATDGTVRSLDGFTATRISSRDVERDIQATASSVSLRASVYTTGGNAFWVLSSPSWTWEYNITTQAWNERRSHGLDRWRGECSVKFAGQWYVGDIASTKIQRIASAAYLEDGAALVVRGEGLLKDFPARMRVPSIDFDFTMGQGVKEGDVPIETDPTVGISISHDGGASWSNPLFRRLGEEGEFKRQVRVHNLGRSTPKGIRVAFEVSDPVWFQFRGATLLNVIPRRP